MTDNTLRIWLDGGFASGLSLDQVSSDSSAYKFFEWNGIDTSQFDNVENASAQSNIVSITAQPYAGRQWLHVRHRWTNTPVTPPNDQSVSSYLPINVTPQNDDYRIEADIVVLQPGAGALNVIGAGLAVRYSSPTAAYTVELTNTIDGAASTAIRGRALQSPVTGVSRTVTTPFDGLADMNVKDGMRLGIGARGSGTTDDALGTAVEIRYRAFDRVSAVDTDALRIKARGRPALTVSGLGYDPAPNPDGSEDTIVLFRNIRCYYLR